MGPKKVGVDFPPPIEENVMAVDATDCDDFLENVIESTAESLGEVQAVVLPGIAEEVS